MATSRRLSPKQLFKVFEGYTDREKCEFEALYLSSSCGSQMIRSLQELATKRQWFAEDIKVKADSEQEKWKPKVRNGARDELVNKLLDERRLTEGEIMRHPDVKIVNGNKFLTRGQLKGIKSRRRQKNSRKEK